MARRLRLLYCGHSCFCCLVCGVFVVARASPAFRASSRERTPPGCFTIFSYAVLEICEDLLDQSFLAVTPYMCPDMYQEVGGDEPEAQCEPWVACASPQLSLRKADAPRPAAPAADVPSE